MMIWTFRVFIQVGFNEDVGDTLLEEGSTWGVLRDDTES